MYLRFKKVLNGNSFEIERSFSTGGICYIEIVLLLRTI